MDTNRTHSHLLTMDRWEERVDHATFGNTLTTNIGQWGPTSEISFNVQGEPMLTLCANGDIQVQGRLATNDMEVVEAMRQFLTEQGRL